MQPRMDGCATGIVDTARNVDGRIYEQEC
jgi:hypothetical protein